MRLNLYTQKQVQPYSYKYIGHISLPGFPEKDALVIHNKMVYIVRMVIASQHETDLIVTAANKIVAHTFSLAEMQ